MPPLSNISYPTSHINGDVMAQTMIMATTDYTTSGSVKMTDIGEEIEEQIKEAKDIDPG